MFDFRRITLFCLEKRFSKHKMTIFSKNLGGAWSLCPPRLCLWLQPADTDKIANLAHHPKRLGTAGIEYWIWIPIHLTVPIRAVAYAENFHEAGFIHWHMLVICIWCALFVTSQFDVTFMFPNQRFGDVFWHDLHILLHALPLFFVSLHWI